MSSINHTSITGNVVRKPELRATAAGNRVLSFTVAVDEARKQDDGTYADHASYIGCALFGKRADMMPSLAEGPYYAVRVISAIDGTYNGIRVNENLQAVNSDYQPIPGLYVAGQDSGGFFSYPYYEGVGWTQGYAWNSGSVAAKHMIASIKAE